MLGDSVDFFFISIYSRDWIEEEARVEQINWWNGVKIESWPFFQFFFLGTIFVRGFTDPINIRIKGDSRARIRVEITESHMARALDTDCHNFSGKPLEISFFSSIFFPQQFLLFFRVSMAKGARASRNKGGNRVFASAGKSSSKYLFFCLKTWGFFYAIAENFY